MISDRLLQIADGAQKAVGRRGLGIDQAMQTEAVLQREQDRAGPCRIQRRFLPLFFAVVSTISVISCRRARRRLASSGRRFSARATNRIISMCSRGERPSGSCLRAVHVSNASRKSVDVLVLRQQFEIAPDGLLDVILEHGDDQLVLALEIRIEGAAREAGRGRDGLDAGAADALFLEHARRRFEQFVAGVVPGGSGSDS